MKLKGGDMVADAWAPFTGYEKSADGISPIHAVLTTSNENNLCHALFGMLNHGMPLLGLFDPWGSSQSNRNLCETSPLRAITLPAHTNYSQYVPIDFGVNQAILFKRYRV